MSEHESMATVAAGLRDLSDNELEQVFGGDCWGYPGYDNCQIICCCDSEWSYAICTDPLTGGQCMMPPGHDGGGAIWPNCWG